VRWLHWFALTALLYTVILAGPRPTTADAQPNPDSLYNALHPRLLFDSGDLPALYDKVRDGGHDDDAYTFVRVMVDFIYPGDDEAGILDDDYGLSSVPMLGVATFLESPQDEGARTMGRDVTMYLVNNYGFNGNDFDTSLRLRSLALGYDLFFANAPEAQRQIVRDEIVAYVDSIIMSPTYEVHLYRPYLSNRSAMVAAAVGLAVLVLADETDPTWVDAGLEFSDDIITAWEGYLLDNDGAYNEGVLYAGWSMRHLVYYFVARKRFDGREVATGRVKNMERWLAYELLTEGNGKTNNLNDSGYTDDPFPQHHTYLDWAQWEWQSGLAAYLYEHVAGPYGWDWGPKADKTATVLWNTNIAPVQPDSVLAQSAVWEDRGLYYCRSGWPAGASSDDFVFSFYSGRFQGGHAQEDQNQFTLGAYGAKFAVDHGPGGPAGQSEAHNIVFVDGKGQHNAGGSIGTDGEISDYLLGDFADFVRGDATAAYTTYSPVNNQGYPFWWSDWSWGYVGSNPVLHAYRNIIVVHGIDGVPPYVLMEDDIEKDGAAHSYKWRLHTADVNTVDTTGVETMITAPTGRMIIHALNPARASMSTTLADFNNQSTEPDSKLLTYKKSAVNPNFCFLMLPGDGVTPAPAVARAEYAWGVLTTIDWGARVDVFALNLSGGPIDIAVGLVSASVQTDASKLLLRFDGANVTRYLAADVQALTVDGDALVAISDGPAGVSRSDGVIYLDRQDADFVFYAPGVSEIRYRTQQVHFVEDDGYLTRDPSSGVQSPRRPPVRVIKATAFPNPFNPTTSVAFDLAHDAEVTAAVYDPLGRVVTTLARRAFAAGHHVLRWDGTDDRGRRVASGVYIVRLHCREGTATVKLTVVK
jgi:hypothetical protein